MLSNGLSSTVFLMITNRFMNIRELSGVLARLGLWLVKNILIRASRFLSSMGLLDTRGVVLSGCSG